MQYNTQKEKLLLKEYGRNVQEIIEYAVTIEDVAHRTKIANAIIELMGQLNPHLKNVEDFKHKLWDHLQIMSDFKINVDSPYPIITKDQVFLKPTPLPYPKKEIKFRHYGKYVERIIKKAIALEDEDKREEFTKIIASYMKLVHRNFNNDGVNDEIVKNDLSLISEGKLRMEDDENIRHLVRNNNTNRNNNNRNNNNRNNGKNNNNNRNNNNRNGGNNNGGNRNGGGGNNNNRNGANANNNFRKNNNAK